MLNLVSRRYLFFGISLLLIIPGLISLFVNGLRVGIDFSGGTLWDVMIPNHSDGTVNRRSTTGLRKRQPGSGRAGQSAGRAEPGVRLGTHS